MKRRTFALFFIAVHVLFILCHIDKQSRIVKLSYAKQKLEQRQLGLTQKKQALRNTLHSLQNRTSIKQYALGVLNMHPIQIKSIKRIPSYAQNV